VWCLARGKKLHVSVETWKRISMLDVCDRHVSNPNSILANEKNTAESSRDVNVKLEPKFVQILVLFVG
jgi:hypothetical protein